VSERLLEAREVAELLAVPVRLGARGDSGGPAAASDAWPVQAVRAGGGARVARGAAGRPVA